jgi:hypothetical protein
MLTGLERVSSFTLQGLPKDLATLSAQNHSTLACAVKNDAEIKA